MTTGILLRGKSLLHLPKFKDNFEECYIVNDWKRELATFGRIIKDKKIIHCVNSMDDAMLPAPLYKEYNIQEIVFAFTSSMVKKGRDPIKKFKRIGLNKFTLIPNIYEDKVLSIHNTGVGCIFYVASVVKATSVFIIGLDFYHQDYMVKKNAPHHKAKSDAIDLVGSFVKIVRENPNTQFNVVSYYRQFPLLDNLNVTIMK